MKLNAPVSFYQHTYSEDEGNSVLKVMKNVNRLAQTPYFLKFKRKVCEVLSVKDGFAVCSTTNYFFNKMVSFSLHYWLREKTGYLCPPTKKVLRELRE